MSRSRCADIDTSRVNALAGMGCARRCAAAAAMRPDRECEQRWKNRGDDDEAAGSENEEPGPQAAR